MNRWTIHVRQFGKIEKADVEVAPLTLFVGDNNSGKSYMMTLIYGLLNVRFFFDGYVFREQSQVFEECCKIMNQIISMGNGVVYKLAGQELGYFQKLINEILEDNKDRFLLSLFNRKMIVGEMRISFPKDMELNFSATTTIDGSNLKERILIKGKVDDEMSLAGYWINKDDLINNKDGYKFIVSYVMECMLQWEMENSTLRKRIYFPTARTGFLLTYKTLTGNAVQEKFTLEETRKNLLTKPNSDFLKELGNIDTTMPNVEFEDITQFIENDLIAGEVGVMDRLSQDLVYIPRGLKQQLPLYVTSGVVTEMTPLLLFLKYVDLGALLIEEPEISLHPQLQIQVARVLIQLANKKLPVFVTTHSDLIVQHINNMIKANEMKERNEFLCKSKYQELDLLSRKDICVYQFDVDESQKSNVERLPCGEYGFEVMTFYNTLQKMNLEIQQIEKRHEYVSGEGTEEDEDL